MSKFFIGIDGGGTKTDFLLVNDAGKIISNHKLGPSSYLSIGIDGLYDIIRNGVGQLLIDSGLNLFDVKGVVIGVPSYGEIESDKKLITDKLFSFLDPKSTSVVNDVEIGFYAGLNDNYGIHIVAGTGSIAYGVNKLKQADRVGGWGDIIGDDGAGYSIGKGFLNYFTKMSDGRLPKGSMYYSLKEVLSLKNDFELLDKIYSNEAKRRSNVASFALFCDSYAKEGDVTCLDILKKSAYELSLHIKSLESKLKMTEYDRLKVSYSGSVFKSNIVLDELCSILGEKYSFIEPGSEPVYGAIALAKKIF